MAMATATAMATAGVGLGAGFGARVHVGRARVRVGCVSSGGGGGRHRDARSMMSAEELLEAAQRRRGAGDEKFDLVFGGNSAPDEIWEGLAADARDKFHQRMRGLVADSDSVSKCSLLETALWMGAEDDAVFSRGSVGLPVESYQARVNVMADELVVSEAVGEAGQGMREALEAIEHYVWEEKGFRCVSALGLQSGWRVYVHHVLAQKCGTPLSLCVVLKAVATALQERGVGAFAEAKSGMSWETLVHRRDPSRRPRLVLAENAALETLSGEWYVASDAEIIRGMLRSLVRAFWAWEGAPDEVDPWEREGADQRYLWTAAEAAAGSSGRIGTRNNTTGVIQATGRPFGNVGMARMSSERMAEFFGDARSLRDHAVLLCHEGEKEQALRALQLLQDADPRFAAFLASESDDVVSNNVPGERYGSVEDELRCFVALKAIMDMLTLELSFELPDASKK